MNDAYAPTPRLRWVRVPGLRRETLALEQWWAPAVADYMRGSEGEWRRVVVEEKP